MDKPELRRLYKQRCRALSPGQRAELSAAVCESLIQTAAWRGARTVVLFEPDALEPLLDRLWRPEIRVDRVYLLPRTTFHRDGRPDRLSFHAVADRSTLVPGPYPGILEPCPANHPETAFPVRCDLVLVPGLAFDREGFRLGRGAGWYDRTFSAWAPLPSRFGLCFSFQRSDALLPSEPHDVPMTDIVCDDGQLRA